MAAVAEPSAAAEAARFSWRPFVLVAGLLLVGVTANHDGVFAWAAGEIARLPGTDLGLYAAAMVLVAGTTAVLNLDTSVAFLTPVLILLSRRRGLPELWLIYGTVMMSNAASLLLPGSNLTNLLILQDVHAGGADFAEAMFPAWIAAVVVTAAVVPVMLDGATGRLRADGLASARPHAVGLAGIGLAVIVILAVPDPALPMLAVGGLSVGVRVLEGSLSPAVIRRQVDLASLFGIFGIAVALGTLARTWDGPARLIAHSNSVETAVIGAGASVLVNNLPAAVLLGSGSMPHSRSLLIGLNIGPNLAVTGSLSALIWWQAAHGVGAHPSVLRYSAIGIVAAPLAIAAALVAAAVW